MVRLGNRPWGNQDYRFKYLNCMRQRVVSLKPVRLDWASVEVDAFFVCKIKVWYVMILPYMSKGG
jgi:hypothetical protein